MLRTPYSTSAYRLLGLPATATSGEIRARAQQLRLASEVGQTMESDFSGRWLSDEAPSPEAIRMAASRAEDPRGGAIERSLWFWVTDAADERAANQMSRGALQSAEQIWRRRVQTTKGSAHVAAAHNLAVLLHARSLHCDEPELAEEALQLWSQVLSDPGFFASAPSRETRDPQAVPGDSELAPARESIANAVLMATAAAAREALDAAPADGTVEDAEAHVQALLESGFPSRLVESASEKACEVEVGRADSMASAALDRLRDGRNAEDDDLDWSELCGDAFAEMRESAQKLQQLHEFDLSDVGAVRAVSDKVALALRDMVLASLFRARNVDMSRAALALAKDLAYRETTRAELAEAEAELRQHGERIQFYEDADRERACVTVVMDSGGSVRVPPMCVCCLGNAGTKTHVSYSWTEDYVVYRRRHTVSLDFPLCSSCAKHANDASGKSLAGVALSMVAGLLLAGLLLLVWRAAPPLYLFLTALVGVVPTYAVFDRRHPLVELGPEHASRANPVQMVKTDAGACFTFTNPRYGLAFAQANGVSPSLAGGRDDPSKVYAPIWSSAGVLSVLVAALLILVGGYFAYPQLVDVPQSTQPSTAQSPATVAPPAPPVAVAPVPPATVPVASPPIVQVRPLPELTPPDTEVDDLKAEIDSERPRLQQMKLELRSLDAEIAESEGKLGDLKSRIRQMETDSDLGLAVDQDEYERLLSEHNSLVGPHNERVQEAKALAADYNTAVSSFNAKVRKYNALVRR